MTGAPLAWWQRGPGCGIWAGDLSIRAARLAWVVPAGTLCSGQSRTGHGAILDAGVVGLGRQHGFGSLLISSPACIFGCAGCWSPAPCRWRLAQGPQTSARCRCLHPLAVAGRAMGLSRTPWAARFGVQPGAPSGSSGSPKPQDFGAGRASRGSSKLSNLQPGACREQPGRAWAPPDLGGSGQPRTQKGGLAAQDGSTLGQAEPQRTLKQGQGPGRSHGLGGQEAILCVPKPPRGRRGHLDTLRAECRSADSLVILRSLPPPLQDQLRL